jgi:hypothetical protein
VAITLNANSKITISPGTQLRFVGGGTTGEYAICATNIGGNKTYRYDNTAGGAPVEITTAWSACAAP